MEIRHDLVESIEEIGQAMGLLRETISDIEGGNLRGGKMAGSDALEILSALETKFSGMTARLSRWVDLPEK